jgi:putative transposase
MDNANSFCHTKWECRYHVVWIPRNRRKVLYGQMRKYHGKLLRDPAAQKECKISEGHLQPDHVHVLMEVPKKYSVSEAKGFIKVKSAIQIGTYLGQKKNLPGCIFGREASLYRQKERMKKQYAQTSESKRQRTNASNNCRC